MIKHAIGKVPDRVVLDSNNNWVHFYCPKLLTISLLDDWSNQSDPNISTNYFNRYVRRIRLNRSESHTGSVELRNQYFYDLYYVYHICPTAPYPQIPLFATRTYDNLLSGTPPESIYYMYVTGAFSLHFLSFYKYYIYRNDLIGIAHNPFDVINYTEQLLSKLRIHDLLLTNERLN